MIYLEIITIIKNKNRHKIKHNFLLSKSQQKENVLFVEVKSNQLILTLLWNKLI